MPRGKGSEKRKKRGQNWDSKERSPRHWLQTRQVGDRRKKKERKRENSEEEGEGGKVFPLGAFLNILGTIPQACQRSQRRLARVADGDRRYRFEWPTEVCREKNQGKPKEGTKKNDRSSDERGELADDGEILKLCRCIFVVKKS